MELGERIDETAWQLFTQRGYSRVTMDDLAGELGISKKTLYAAIPGKEALLHRLVMMQVKKAEAYTESVINDPHMTTLEKMLSLPAYGMSVMMEVQPILLEDVRKLSPETWAEAERARDRIISGRVGQIIREGIERGELRDDIEPDIIQDALYFSLNGIIRNSIPIRDVQRLAHLIQTTIKLLYTGLKKENAT